MPDRNEEYYLEDVVFQVSDYVQIDSSQLFIMPYEVEDQLFKVHRRLFVKLSLVFHDMFIRAEADGLTDTQPLVLRGVEKKDFIPLLRCLYPMQFPANSNFSLTLEEWQSVLKLASLYDMVDVKTLVIEEMEPLLINLPSLQIHLAKTYNIQKWLAPALYRLTQRAKPLDEEDARLVGLSDSLKICALREKLRRCEKYGAGIRSGGFGLKEIGHAFDIRDSDLLSSLKLKSEGGERVDSDQSRPNAPIVVARPNRPKRKPAEPEAEVAVQRARHARSLAHKAVAHHGQAIYHVSGQIALRKPLDGLEKLPTPTLWRDHCTCWPPFLNTARKPPQSAATGYSKTIRSSPSTYPRAPSPRTALNPII
ncbi:hypothetical protein F5887DRAFT_1176392 [Amanita rubescens]|nr:hypothetical protein F5887DRAFT_1176392 [Amanita rubescens]